MSKINVLDLNQVDKEFKKDADEIGISKKHPKYFDKIRLFTDLIYELRSKSIEKTQYHIFSTEEIIIINFNKPNGDECFIPKEKIKFKTNKSKFLSILFDYFYYGVDVPYWFTKKYPRYMQKNSVCNLRITMLEMKIDSLTRTNNELNDMINNF